MLSRWLRNQFGLNTRRERISRSKCGGLETRTLLAALYSLSDTFKLHSDPTATKTIYLDFNGQTVSGTLWNTQDNNGQPFTLSAFNSEGDSGSFTNNELERIQRIWARVAEDFAPFHVDVTTEEPPTTDLINSGGTDTQWGIRVIVGGVFPPQGDHGGVAYVGSFNWDSDTPALVFADNMNMGDEKDTAEAISHEVGHSLGLSHDGRVTPEEEYYGGHGNGATSWGPIMGVGYYTMLTQWSQGEYSSATNPEDDLSIITTQNGFGYKQDDFADSEFGSGIITATAAGSVLTVDQSGIIEQRSDFDFFELDLGDGTVNLNISGGPVGSNLDILAEVYDANGNLVTWSNPTDDITATISFTSTTGVYFLKIDGVGKGDPLAGGYTDYGSLGQYRITGTMPNPSVIKDQTLPAVDEYAPLGTIVGSVSTLDPIGGRTLTFSIIDGNSEGVFAIDSVTGEITVTNSDAIDWELHSQFQLKIQVNVIGTPSRVDTAIVTIPVNDITTFRLRNGQLTIKATRFEDQITVFASGGTIQYLDGNKTVNTLIPVASVQSIQLSGLAGHDTLKLDRSLGTAIVNTVLGGYGNDTLIGSLGRDTLNGDLGVDTVSYEQALSSVNVSLLVNGIQDTKGGGLDTLISIENITGSDFNDNLVGNYLSNILTGRAGNDTLSGGAGHDQLQGDDGIDQLLGGDGNDALLFDTFDSVVNGAGGVDTALLLQATQALNFNMVTGKIEVLDVSVSTFNNILNAAKATWPVTIYGGSGNDTLTGGSAGDSLLGGGGADSLIGNKGNDLLSFDNLDSILGGAGSDAAIVNGASASISLNLVRAAIETVNATASTFANRFDATGASWSVNILGGSGADTILGGNKNDQLFGQGGNDTITGQGGNDLLNGGDGTDTVSYATATAGVRVQLSSGIATGGAGNDTLVGFENITGSMFSDYLSGDSKANVISGFGGLDTIFGGGGLDTISP